MLTSFFSGSSFFLQGLRWYTKNPKYLLLSFIPFFLAIILGIVGLWLFFKYDSDFFAKYFWETPEVWYLLAMYYLGKGLVYLTAIGMIGLLCLLVMSILASPIFEMVSYAVEKERMGEVRETSFLNSLKLIPQEIIKAFFIFLIPLVFFFIPVLVFLSFPTAAILVAWELTDLPMARRGMSVKSRLNFLWKNTSLLLGLGIWLALPFFQFISYPLGVAGATMLYLSKEKA